MSFYAFRVSQIVDNGSVVQLSLIENVQTEPISQKQMIRESVSKKLDPETKKQVMPLLDAIMQAQPTIILVFNSKSNHIYHKVRNIKTQ